MNSSDEAVEALTRLIADHPMWIADNGRALDYLPEREAKISDFLDEARSIFAAFAAAVRAEAVTTVRQQIENLHYEVDGQCSVCGDEYDNPQDWPCQTAAIFLVEEGTDG